MFGVTMNMLLILSPLFCLLCLIPVNGFNSKYSQQSNAEIKEKMAEVKPFRIKKMNMLWLTAKKKLLSEEARTNLFQEIQSLDKLEIRLKKMRAEGSDQDGAMEAKCLYHFKRIVEKYSLEDVNQTNDIKKKTKSKTSSDSSVDIEDSKLQEMWTHAQHAGFSEEDLNILREEFSHQQMKIKEFNIVHGEDHDLDELENNEIDMTDEGVKGREIVKLRDRQNIQDGFQRLEQMTNTMTPVTGSFEDPRVNSLWNMALKSKWSAERLDSFKEELKHFEKRVIKQKYFAEQLKFSKESFENTPEQHEHLEKKTEMLNREVKKYHAGLKERVTKAIKHLEL